MQRWSRGGTGRSGAGPQRPGRSPGGPGHPPRLRFRPDRLRRGRRVHAPAVRVRRHDEPCPAALLQRRVPAARDAVARGVGHLDPKGAAGTRARGKPEAAARYVSVPDGVGRRLRHDPRRRPCGHVPVVELPPGEHPREPRAPPGRGQRQREVPPGVRPFGGRTRTATRCGPVRRLNSVEGTGRRRRGGGTAPSTVSGEKRVSDEQQGITEDQWRRAELIWGHHRTGRAPRPRRRGGRTGRPRSAEAVLPEPDAADTGQDITLAREVLAAASAHPASVLLVRKPYTERRAYATARKLWPGAGFLDMLVGVSSGSSSTRSSGSPSSGTGRRTCGRLRVPGPGRLHRTPRHDAGTTGAVHEPEVRGREKRAARFGTGACGGRSCDRWSGNGCTGWGG